VERVFSGGDEDPTRTPAVLHVCVAPENG
jgi:hypothetical protein